MIVDEAHSSQTGETARELKAILGAKVQSPNGEDEPDWEDSLNQVMQSRGRQPNLSFFAFTATPKGKTLELFGRPGATETGSLSPLQHAAGDRGGFHPRCADELHTYKTYYRLVKAAEDDPELPKKKAAGAGKVHVAASAQHRAEDRGHGRALPNNASNVSTRRRRWSSLLRAFMRCATSSPSIVISSYGYTDIRPLVAFSGTVKDPDTGLEYTEPGMNIGRRYWKAHQRGAASGALRFARLSGAAGREQVPDRI